MDQVSALSKAHDGVEKIKRTAGANALAVSLSSPFTDIQHFNFTCALLQQVLLKVKDSHSDSPIGRGIRANQ
jgi:hypothetical protein